MNPTLFGILLFIDLLIGSSPKTSFQVKNILEYVVIVILQQLILIGSVLLEWKYCRFPLQLRILITMLNV